MNYSGADNLAAMTHARRYNAAIHQDLEAVARKYAGAPLSRILDVGAGLGTFANELARHFLVRAVEPDPDLAASIRCSVHASLKDLGSIPRYHLAYSLNVLEHIEDDRAFLSAIHGVLAPQGALYLMVPAFQGLYSNMDRHVGHYRRYGRNELMEKVSAAGFSVVRCHYFDSAGFFAQLAHRVLGCAGSLSADTVAFYDRSIFPASRILDRMGMKHLVGKNLILEAVIA